MQSMLKPLNDRILVRLDPKAEKVTQGGIILTGEKEELCQTGTVIHGAGNFDVGNRVAFSRYGFDDIEIDGEKLCLVARSSILGIFE